MTDAVVVRRAVPSDVEQLAALSGELGYPVARDVLSERLELLVARGGEIVLVAELAGRVVGWVHGSEQVFLETGRRCELLGLVVEGRHRGGGLGRLLVTAVEEWATSRGLDQMAVRSNVARSDSHPFYERLGYARVKTQHAYRKRLGAPA